MEGASTGTFLRFGGAVSDFAVISKLVAWSRIKNMLLDGKDQRRSVPASFFLDTVQHRVMLQFNSK